MKFQDVEETFRILSHRPSILDPLERDEFNQLRTETKKKFERKKSFNPLLKITLTIIIDPHPSLFFSSQNPNLSLLATSSS